MEGTSKEEARTKYVEKLLALPTLAKEPKRESESYAELELASSVSVESRRSAPPLPFPRP